MSARNLLFYASLLWSAYKGQSFVPSSRSCHGGEIINRDRGLVVNHRRTKLHAAEIATALTSIDALWQSSPYAAAAMTCGFKASAADFVAQKRQYLKINEKREKERTKQENYVSQQEEARGSIVEVEEKMDERVDLKRNVAYLSYGALYQGVTQEFVYNHIYPVMFGSGTELTVVLAKVAFDMLLQTTLVTLPVAYVIKALIYEYSLEEAFRRYKDDIINHGLLLKYISIWGPVQCLTFSVIPEHWRVTFIAFVSFFWVIILSSIASRAQQPVS